MTSCAETGSKEDRVVICLQGKVLLQKACTSSCSTLCVSQMGLKYRDKQGHGSSPADSYRISIAITKGTKGLKKATCSCLYYTKSEGNICKHILAALLQHCCRDGEAPKGVYDNQRTASKYSKTIERERADVKVSSIQNESASKGLLSPGNSSTKLKKSLEFFSKTKASPSQTTKQRSLPNWMKDNQKSSEKKQKANKQSTVFSAFTSSHKRSPPKRKFSIKRTVYCMTPEEFLQTARQIIEEHENKMVSNDAASISKDEEMPNEFEQEKREEVERSSDDSSSHLDELIFGCTNTVKETETLASTAGQLDRRESEDFVVADSLVPQTVTVVPETLNFTSLRRELSTQDKTRKATEYSSKRSTKIDTSAGTRKNQDNCSILDDFL